MTRGSGAARRSRICHQTDASDETRLGNFFHETPVFVYMADAHVRVEGAGGVQIYIGACRLRLAA